MTYACVSLCSIMIAIVVCIARSELNTHIIKIILSVPKCVPKKPNLPHILAHILAHSQPRYNTHSVPPRTALTCASIGEARKQRHDASHGHGHALHTLSRFPQ